MDQGQLLSPERLEQLRADFPILETAVGAHPLNYLDTGATSQRPRQVLDAERAFLESSNGAVHRGAHSLAGSATMLFEESRQAVAGLIGADADEVSWTMNATDALNTVSLGLIRANRGTPEPRLAIGEGDRIVVTEAEHHANLLPWQDLAQATGAELVWIPVDDRGLWSVEDAAQVVNARTRLLAFAHISNVTGFVAPVAELVALAKSVGAITVLDACQSVPHRTVDLHELGVDVAAFSAHKMLGPGGLGVLYLAREFGQALPPARTGGSMITTVTMDQAEYLDPPQRFEAGTQPVSQVIALGAAVEYLQAIGMDAIDDHERALAQRLAVGVESIAGVRLIGAPAGEDRAGLVSVIVDGVHAHDVGQLLDAQGIAARVGHHCAQPLHRRLGVAATTRASTYFTTTTDEVDHFLDVLAGVRAYFGAA